MISLNKIITLLKSNQDELFTNGAFQYFIDNKIDADELNEILLSDGYHLPESFFSLSKYEQKKYRQYIKTKVFIENGKVFTEGKYVMNGPYFYELYARSNKNKQYTDKLIDYIYNLVDYNLLFWGIEFINVKYVSALQTKPLILDYAIKTGKTNLYDLTMELYSKHTLTPDELKVREALSEALDKQNFIGLDLNDKNIIFGLLMETILYSLGKPKEATTLKVKFLILNKIYVSSDAYYETSKSGKALIKDYSSLFKKSLIKRLDDFVKNNKEFFDQMKPNGYKVLYYSIMENQQ